MPSLKQDVTVELYYSGAWHDIVSDPTGYVYADTIKITRGQPSEGSAPRPQKLVAQLANTDDRYRITNPLSPLYGVVGRNTRCRVTVGGALRYVGNISLFDVDQTSDFRQSPHRGRAWCDIEAYGLLGLINQWSGDVQSAMTRQMSSYETVGLWPMEDGSEATQLTNMDAGGRAATWLGTVTPGTDGESGGAMSCTKLGSDGLINFTFEPNAAAGWQVLCHVQLPAVPPSSTYGQLFSLALSNGNAVSWQINDTNYRVVITDSLGASLLTITVARGSVTATNWIRLRLKATVSAGTVTYEPAWYEEDAAFILGTSGTYSAAAVGSLVTGAITPNSINVDALYSHFVGITDTSLDLIGGYDEIGSFNGYAGEKTASRFVRLLWSYGLSWNYVGVFDHQPGMGPQKPDTLINLLKEIETTEGGLMYDINIARDAAMGTTTELSAPATALRLLTERYRRTPAVSLSVADLPGLPKERSDDLNLHNIVTVKQREGSEATAADTTTPFVGAQDPPDGAGPLRQTVNVNLYDQSVLDQHAGWWLGLGTVALPRFPQVVIDLAALADRGGGSTVADIEAVDIGDVIEITDLREDTVRLQVIGYTEEIGTHSRSIAFDCIPDQQYEQAGEWDATDSLWGVETCTLASSAAAGVTSLSLTMSADEEWDTAAGYDFLVAGERVSVTAMTARSGSGPWTQTATVTRAVNGVAKTLPSGSPVQLVNTGRWAL